MGMTAWIFQCVTVRMVHYVSRDYMTVGVVHSLHISALGNCRDCLLLHITLGIDQFVTAGIVHLVSSLFDFVMHFCDYFFCLSRNLSFKR